MRFASAAGGDAGSGSLASVAMLAVVPLVGALAAVAWLGRPGWGRGVTAVAALLFALGLAAVLYPSALVPRTVTASWT